MYQGKFVVDTAAAVPANGRAALTQSRPGSAILGVVVLLVGLPLLAARVFVWAIARDIRRIGIVAATIGDAARRG